MNSGIKDIDAELARHHAQRAYGGNMPKAIEANRRRWIEEYLRRYRDFDMDDARQAFVNANMELWRECVR